MPNVVTAEEPIQKEAGETFVAAVSIDLVLSRMVGTGLVIDSVALRAVNPIVAEDDATDTVTLAVSGVAANTEAFTDPVDGEEYAIGEVILFTLSGGTLGQTYRVFFAVTISGSPEQTITVIVPVEMVG